MKKLALFFAISFSLTVVVAKPAPPMQAKRIIQFVWDGLRPDSINPTDTPNLWALAHKGVEFTDNHSSYPTFTMMNAASFATGDFAGRIGFYGNNLWKPLAHGVNSADKPVDFHNIIFTEDYHILKDINETAGESPVLLPETLMHAVQSAGLKTAAVGKSGPAFLQNVTEDDGMNGIILDEKHVYPLSFAKQLIKQGYPIPALSPNDYPKGALDLPKTNGNPTQFGHISLLKQYKGITDGVTSDPTATSQSPYSKSNAYLMNTYLNKILPVQHPTLSVVWLRNPDTTEHNYGVGSKPYYTALHDQDTLLGLLNAKLKALHMDKTTDLIVVSDHGHSNTAGPASLFPLRNINNGTVTRIDPLHGFSVSGDFRPADLLTRAGFHAYDGQGCVYDPILSGILKNGQSVYPTQFDTSGKQCGGTIKNHDDWGDSDTSVGKKYTWSDYRLPKHLPSDAIVVANDGGSTYFYVPSHQPTLIKKLTRFIQSREEFGALFVDDRYGDIPGTLPLSFVKLESQQDRNPDIIAGSHFNANAMLQGFSGTEFNNAALNRGMHGSFSPRDVHNTLIAFGPDFKISTQDSLPSGNVDLPVTIAKLLGVPFKHRQGRVLSEALKTGSAQSQYRILKAVITPAMPAKQLVFKLPTNPNGHDIDAGKSHFNIVLHTKILQFKGGREVYFDSANALRY